MRATLILSLVAGCGSAPVPPADMALPAPDLNGYHGWTIRSSAEVDADGKAVSQPQFDPQGWYPAEVPSTVVGTLVDDGRYGDPFIGTGLLDIPGTTDYPVGGSFAYSEMTASNPFRVPWWYRAPLSIAGGAAGRRVWLRLGGVNYRGALWVNGQQVADESRIVGTFRAFEFDVTSLVTPGGENAIAVEVSPPTLDALALSFVDWGPAPADKDMGLWRPVSVIVTGPVRLRDAYVHPRLDLKSLATAELTVSAELENGSDAPVDAVVEGTIETIHISQKVTLGPREKRHIAFDPAHFPTLKMASPRLWWPRPLGAQDLYRLDIAVSVGGTRSDGAAVSFGVRDVSSELTLEGYRLFRVNGRPILIRGGGFAPDLFLRDSPQRLEDQIRYAAEMGLNALRLEGKVGTEDLYDLADRYGIFLLAGWSCCDQWEWWTANASDHPGDGWTSEDRAVAPASLADQIRLLRNHPSALAWLTGSDRAPPEEIQKQYVDVLTSLDWPNPMIAGASAEDAPPLGPTGVKMSGPYMWVPPSYWSTDHNNGGAFGFNTETSPGAAIPPLETLKKFIPADHLWPPDDVWLYHAGGRHGAGDGWDASHQISVFRNAQAARYGGSDAALDFTRVAQLAAYEGERAMFEAYGKNKYHATGVVQWMFNNQWPSLIWNLFDWYLKPGGGYFGARKANEPIHIQYGYDDGSVQVVSSLLVASLGLHAEARVIDRDGKLISKADATVNVEADAVVTALTLALPTSVEGNVYFVDLSLSDSSGVPLSRNLYWLSTKPDVIDPATASYYVTLTSQYADFTGLRAMSPAAIMAAASLATDGADEVVTCTLSNPTTALAFFTRVEVTGARDEEVVPIRWSDNYVTLLPGETRVLQARYRAADRKGAPPSLRIEGWNVPRTILPVQ